MGVITQSYGALETVKDPVTNKTCYRFTVTYCNTSDRRLRLMVTENPWLKTPGSPDHGSKLYVADAGAGEDPDAKTAKQKAVEHARFWTLWPKGDKSGRDCRTISFTFCQPIVCAYNDVYIIPDEEMTIPDDPDDFPDAYETGGMHRFDMQRFGALQLGEPVGMFAVSVPFSRPMAIDDTYIGPATFSLIGLEGLPPSLELVGSVPAFDEPVELEAGDRNSVATLMLRQTEHAEIDEEFVLTVVQAVLSPKEFCHLPPRRASFRVQVTPPRVLDFGDVQM